MTISLTRTQIYDADNDYDTNVDRIDTIEDEEVLAYVPVTSPYRDYIIQVLKDAMGAMERHSDLADSLGDTIPVPNTY